MIEIVFFIIAHMWIVFTAQVDYEHISKQQYIEDHSSRLSVRIFTGILVGIVAPVGGLALGLFFWATFDALLNSFRGLPLFYTGSVASTDKFFSDKKYLLIITKVISFTLGCFLLFRYGL